MSQTEHPPMSRLALVKPAVREKTPAKLMISAGEGGGKTETALRMGRVLAGPTGEILFIDTERGKALLYAGRHTFQHIRWNAPYDPDELANDVIAAGDQYPVIIVDSIYSFWSDEGGVRDIADRSGPRNNGFAGWKDARPAHRRMVNGLIDSRAHVILCCRAKVDYVQETNPATGRQQVRSLGMQPMTDDFLPAEVDLHLRMDAETHAIEVAKSRIEPIPQGMAYAGSDAEMVAGLYAEWCQGGEPLASPEDVAEIEAAMSALPDPEHRMASKRTFFERLGRPRQLRETQVVEARAMVAQFQAEAEQSAASIAPPAARPTLTSAPAPTTEKVAAGSVDPGRLASWVNLSERLPNVLGAEADGFKQWMRAGGRSWRPTTATALDEVVDEARRRFRDSNGGARQWDPVELGEVRLLIDELKGQPRDWADFVEVAFENLADADAPETWTDDHVTAFSTWIRLGSAPPSSNERSAHDHPQQHDHAA